VRTTHHVRDSFAQNADHFAHDTPLSASFAEVVCTLGAHAALNLDLTTPNRDLTTPNRDLTTPNRDLTTPNRDLTATKRGELHH